MQSKQQFEAIQKPKTVASFNRLSFSDRLVFVGLGPKPETALINWNPKRADGTHLHAKKSATCKHRNTSEVQ